MKPDSTPVSSGKLAGRLMIAAVLLCGPALAADAPTSTTRTASTPTESQREAAAILRSMAEYLAGLKAFTCTNRNGYEVLQSSGQKIEFGETREVTVARPGQLRIEEVSSDGVRDLALFDGKLMTIYNADDSVYAQAPQPGSLDDALVYFVRDLHMRMPLALLLSTHLKSELPAMVSKIDYVEETDILGVPTHHIAGRTDAVDFQFWIAEGERALPMRVVITYKHAPGQPQFWAELSDWNTSPKLLPTTFQLKLPKDARKIAFAVQVPIPGVTLPAAAQGEVKP